MKYKEQFFNESCLECFQPSTLCSDDEKRKCYIEWADKKIKEHYVCRKNIKLQLAKLNKIVLSDKE